MAVKTKSENYREGLIESIKVTGQMMIDNAEDLAGKMDMMTSIDISVNFDPEGGSIPELTVNRSYIPPKEEVLRLHDVYTGRKTYEPKECEIRGE